MRSFVHVNPNHTEHAFRKSRTASRAARLASSSAPVVALMIRCSIRSLPTPVRRGMPVLHHIWQHRQRDWGMQEASDAIELVRLANRHPKTNFILAHIGGGGDWAHTINVIRDAPNVYPDTSGSGVDRGMLDAYLDALGAERLLWAADLTLCTGLAKLQALDVIGLPDGALDDICWRNAVRIFPPKSFPVE